MNRFSGFCSRRRQLSSGYLIYKVLALVGTIAERFRLGMPASAQAHGRSATEAEFLPFLIHNLKITFDANRPIIEYRHFGSCHEFPPYDDKPPRCTKRLQDSGSTC
jgi:hypothetical protein